MYTACIVDALADPYLLAQIQIVHFSWGGSIIKKYNHTYHLRNYSLYMHTCTRPDPDYFLHFHNNTNSLFTSSPNPSRPDPDFFAFFKTILGSHPPTLEFFVASTHSTPDFFCIFTITFILGTHPPPDPSPIRLESHPPDPPPPPTFFFFFFWGGGHFQITSILYPTPPPIWFAY